MRNKKIYAIAALFAVYISGANASSNLIAPHFWSKVHTPNGTWDATLQMVNEEGSFVTRDGTPINHFVVKKTEPQEFGFNLDPNDDFDVAFSLVLTQRNKEKTLRFRSKTCVFIVTASAPARPDVKSIDYNGAKCHWSMQPGVGQDFTVE